MHEEVLGHGLLSFSKHILSSTWKALEVVCCVVSAAIETGI